MKGKKVLLVDDDTYIRDITKRAFARNGAQVIEASDGQEAMNLFRNFLPDLVVLDIMMPIMDGWETCRQIRLVSDVPVIMLTSLSGDREIIRGLECGADDFVSKPINIQVLLARAQAVLRRAKPKQSTLPMAAYQDKHLLIDLEKRIVSVDGEQVNLTPTEYRLLEYMVLNVGKVLAFAQILETVWGEAYRDSPNYVHVYMSHLRQKLEPDPRTPVYFLTEYGTGYRFMPQKPG